VTPSSPTGIRSAVYAWLLANPTLVGPDGCFGPAANPRIYPHWAPNGVIREGPMVVYKRSDAPGERSLRGHNGLRFATFDCEVWGLSSAAVEDATERLRAHVEGAAHTVHGRIAIRGVELLGEVDDAARLEDGTEETAAVSVLTTRLSYVSTSGGV